MERLAVHITDCQELHHPTVPPPLPFVSLRGVPSIHFSPVTRLRPRLQHRPVGGARSCLPPPSPPAPQGRRCPVRVSGTPPPTAARRRRGPRGTAAEVDTARSVKTQRRSGNKDAMSAIPLSWPHFCWNFGQTPRVPSLQEIQPSCALENGPS